MKKLLSLGILSMLLLGWACTEKEDENSFVVTEQILHASGDQIRVLGRVISTSQIQVSDHGFYFSQDPSFSSPIVISLGPKEGPGRFIGLAEGLEIHQLYYVKSFMELGGEILEGNVMEVETLQPFIESISPLYGEEGDQLVISGGNFAANTRIFFGSQEAQILDIILESQITLTVPPLKDESSVRIKLISQGEEQIFSENFEYQIGAYELVTTYPEAIRLYDNVFFQTDQGFTIGLGSRRRIDLIDGFQRFSLISKEWSRVSFPGNNRSYAFFTDHFIGGGTAERGANPTDIDHTFWRINENGFTQLPDLPFESLESIAFEINSDLFVLGTKMEEGASFRKYDPQLAQWTSLPAPPENFNAEDAVFSYGGYGYVIGADRTLWRFDPNSLNWEPVSTYPGSLGQGYGMARVLGDKVYIGLFRRSNEMWELDMETFTWKSKNPMPGYPQSILVGHFIKNGFLYIIRGPDITLSGDFPMDLYQFDPTSF
ncbi:IPT/TIG domain-containing protein [Algoriphagus sp. PAP.12]|uniref:IPT/TIG domain-containing protein n=1 Tax=Algoriphagus sp. PAP.12 TaxID=2996678 RepID=UPI00227AED3C|nr:IPT/TIG domain-containing protein [Algoriphagus sp. PAP.12]